MHLERIAATRYVTPLREGGSLPALVEADDDGLYVLKFRGAGQGRKALVAEVVAGELARALGLARARARARRARPRARPRRAGPRDPGPAVASAGLNLGVDFLPGALPFSPAAGPAPTPSSRRTIVWFDALVTNVDRTAQNPNLLRWHDRLWLIDHGAALYFHHAPRARPDARARARSRRSPSTCSFRTPARSRDADERLAPGVDARAARATSPPRSRTSGSTATTAASTSTISATRLEAPRDVRRRGRGGT